MMPVGRLLVGILPVGRLPVGILPVGILPVGELGFMMMAWMSSRKKVNELRTGDNGV